MADTVNISSVISDLTENTYETKEDNIKFIISNLNSIIANRINELSSTSTTDDILTNFNDLYSYISDDKDNLKSKYEEIVDTKLIGFENLISFLLLKYYLYQANKDYVKFKNVLEILNLINIDSKTSSLNKYITELYQLISLYEEDDNNEIVILNIKKYIDLIKELINNNISSLVDDSGIVETVTTEGVTFVDNNRNIASASVTEAYNIRFLTLTLNNSALVAQKQKCIICYQNDESLVNELYFTNPILGIYNVRLVRKEASYILLTDVYYGIPDGEEIFTSDGTRISLVIRYKNLSILGKDMSAINVDGSSRILRVKLTTYDDNSTEDVSDDEESETYTKGSFDILNDTYSNNTTFTFDEDSFSKDGNILTANNVKILRNVIIDSTTYSLNFTLSKKDFYYDSSENKIGTKFSGSVKLSSGTTELSYPVILNVYYLNSENQFYYSFEFDSESNFDFNTYTEFYKLIEIPNEINISSTITDDDIKYILKYQLIYITKTLSNLDSIYSDYTDLKHGISVLISQISSIYNQYQDSLLTYFNNIYDFLNTFSLIQQLRQSTDENFDETYSSEISTEITTLTSAMTSYNDIESFDLNKISESSMLTDLINILTVEIQNVNDYCKESIESLIDINLFIDNHSMFYDYESNNNKISYSISIASDIVEGTNAYTTAYASGGINFIPVSNNGLTFDVWYDNISEYINNDDDEIFLLYLIENFNEIIYGKTILSESDSDYIKYFNKLLIKLYKKNSISNGQLNKTDFPQVLLYEKQLFDIYAITVSDDLNKNVIPVAIESKLQYSSYLNGIDLTSLINDDGTQKSYIDKYVKSTFINSFYRLNPDILFETLCGLIDAYENSDKTFRTIVCERGFKDAISFFIRYQDESDDYYIYDQLEGLYTLDQKEKILSYLSDDNTEDLYSLISENYLAVYKFYTEINNQNILDTSKEAYSLLYLKEVA